MPGPSKPSDFNIYQEQFQGGYVETLAQNTEGITELTSGGILMTSDEKKAVRTFRNGRGDVLPCL